MSDEADVTHTAEGFVVWFVGRPASGKTTLAGLVRQALAARDVHSVILDSDELRKALTPEATFSETERDRFYGAVAYLAVWLARSGVNVLIAATGHRQAYRSQVREQVARFAEVEVRCPLAVCQARDPKGLYRRSASGEVRDLPGLGGTIELPHAPDVVVDNDTLSPAAAAAVVIDWLADTWHVVEPAAGP